MSAVSGDAQHPDGVVDVSIEARIMALEYLGSDTQPSQNPDSTRVDARGAILTR
jgi:hypothetical protein